MKRQKEGNGRDYRVSFYLSLFRIGAASDTSSAMSIIPLHVHGTQSHPSPPPNTPVFTEHNISDT